MRSASRWSAVSASSSGSGVESSARKCPNSDSSSSPTGFSSETGVCALRLICSTSSGRHLDVARDLLDRRLATALGAQLPLRAKDPVELLDDVDGHPDRPALVRDRARDRLPDPPRRVRRELEALAVVELLGGADEPDRPLLDQVEERQALVPVALGDRDDESEVRLHHRLLRAVVAALDALGELDLLGGGQERDASDVLQEELERVGRDLGIRLGLALDVLLLGVDDRDLRLVERGVELVELARLEIELVERERDLVGVESPGLRSRSRADAAPRRSRGRPRPVPESPCPPVSLRPDRPPCSSAVTP